jgi:hypothetical protein
MRYGELANYSPFDAVGKEYGDLSGQYETTHVDKVEYNITHTSITISPEIKATAPAAGLRVAHGAQTLAEPKG